jgi:hypothetical protein
MLKHIVHIVRLNKEMLIIKGLNFDSGPKPDSSRRITFSAGFPSLLTPTIPPDTFYESSLT